MTLTTSPPAPAVPSPAGTAYVDVPARLVRWQAAAVAACLVAGVLTGLFQVLSWHANRAAAADTEQLVRVQGLRSTLLRADSLATSAFLVGGLEPPAQRAAYDRAIAEVTRQVATAAEAQPADRDALAALNQAVTTYATTITQARDNNRQGFPVGSAYLGTASGDLRSRALPVLDALVSANAERAEGEMGAQRPWLVVLPGLVALLVIVLLNRRLATTFRRRLNPGLLGAAVLLLVVVLLALVVSLGQRADNADLRAGSFRAAVDEATARSAGNDARANESLRLVNRGSGETFEQAYDAAARTVTARAGAVTLPLWQAYDALHQQVVALDEAGRYDDAVAAATSTADGASADAFDTFDAAAREVVAENAVDTTTALRSGNAGILVLSVVSVMLGLAGAALCAWGIGLRRREYA